MSSSSSDSSDSGDSRVVIVCDCMCELALLASTLAIVFFSTRRLRAVVAGHGADASREAKRHKRDNKDDARERKKRSRKDGKEKKHKHKKHKDGKKRKKDKDKKRAKKEDRSRGHPAETAQHQAGSEPLFDFQRPAAANRPSQLQSQCAPTQTESPAVASRSSERGPGPGEIGCSADAAAKRRSMVPMSKAGARVCVRALFSHSPPAARSLLSLSAPTTPRFLMRESATHACRGTYSI